MMVFLFIAISYMYHMHQIAQSYVETKQEIYKALYNEFKDDLHKESWNASIDPETLTITFNAPQVQFERNRADLKESYKEVLQDFFPRYLRVLSKFKNEIEEIRIEGHTSSIWNNKVSDTIAYFKNMALSQDRTRSVLEYVYQLPSTAPYRPWLKEHVAAVGFSSAHIIKDKDGNEDYNASRRVSFRILTNAEASIKEILESGQ
ncbi:MAG: OmpA family protein [Hydrogenimonas sp.]|nr:MAG: OmpA family protein [Hydrogenimonas sp.]